MLCRAKPKKKYQKPWNQFQVPGLRHLYSIFPNSNLLHYFLKKNTTTIHIWSFLFQCCMEHQMNESVSQIVCIFFIILMFDSIAVLCD